MADFVASVLAPTVESALKYVGAVIKRQFIYLCCFISNITGLEDEAQNLDDVASELQARVNAANNNVQGIKPEVESWLRASNNIKVETNRILNEVPNVESDCFTLRARFSLSKRAIKATESMTQHREKCKLFSDISLPPPSAASRPTPLGTTYEFNSRKKIEQDIMTALRDNKEKMIGVCGMGGLGKTTMAKRIMNRALEEHVFQEAVFAVVSQAVDESKIQLEIGGTLGLDLKNQTAQGRVQKLHERLSSGTRKILLVLDDVWKSLDLNELGIPCEGDCEGCTILITSRNGDALRQMDVKKVFGMEHLSEDDAWFLFREKAGTCVDDRKLKSTAKKVVEKCRGLPIALATVGAALRDEKSLSVWKDALKQLRKPNPNNTPDFIAQVYNPVVVSYDRLDSEEAKSIFLLCCLYAEDANISVERLTYFCMGLRIFKDMGSLEEARDRMCTLLKSLKTRSLLLDARNEDDVRMHDVVRDVCVFTAKQKGYIGGNDCTWISSIQLPGEGTEGLGFPNLRLLFSTDEEIFEIDNTFFQGIRELYVLSIEDYSWTSLPLATQSLKSLRTLLLDSCGDLEAISVVGGLVNLEILICRNCCEIEELPQEMEGLKHLKLLQLTDCLGLQSIGPGIISSLVGLEELKMSQSFKQWEADDGGEERENASLRELESLAKLTCLEIEIADPALAAQEINLSSKIERFEIIIGADYIDAFPQGSTKKMVLCREEGTCLGHWIEKLLKDTEYLYLTGDGANNLDLANIPNIRWLKLEGCESMKNIVTTSMDDIDDDGRYTLFPHMECLELSDLPQLEQIWNGPISSNSFQNIKKIRLEYLPALKHLWKSSSTSLPQLESLEISKCEMMEQVFLWSEEDENKSNMESPNRIEFPLLRRISISQCPKMRSIIPTTSLNGDIDDHSSHLFCQPQKVSFGSLNNLLMERNPLCRHNNIHVSFFNQLETLKIFKYHGRMSLFMPSIAKNLVNLKNLFFNHCDEMVKVIEDEETASSDGERTTLLFPKLRVLELRNLPKLETFCEWKHDVELPLLKKLDIVRCPNMTKFTMGSTTTPHLEFVHINWTDGYSIDASTDLNGALHQRFADEEKKRDEYGDGYGSDGDGDGDEDEDAEMEKKRPEDQKKHMKEDEESTSNEEKEGQNK